LHNTKFSAKIILFIQYAKYFRVMSALRGGLGGLDISNIPAGMYFVRITTENGVVVKKIIKQ
jgi:hypothetical protein